MPHVEVTIKALNNSGIKIGKIQQLAESYSAHEFDTQPSQLINLPTYVDVVVGFSSENRANRFMEEIKRFKLGSVYGQEKKVFDTVKQPF